MRNTGRLLSGMLLLLLATLGVVSAAAALSSPDQIGNSLKSSPVYNDPDAAGALSPSDEVKLVEQIQGSGTPIYVAVVSPKFLQAAGSPDNALNLIAQSTGLPGTYAVIGTKPTGGNTFRANTTCQNFVVNDVATKAAASNQGGTYYAVLSTFVDGVAQRASSAGGCDSSSKSSFPWGWVLIGGGVVGAGGLVAYSQSKKKKQAQEQLAAVKTVVDEDVTSFGEKVAAYDISDPRLDDAGRADLMSAIDSYRAASDGSERMTAATQAGVITSHLEDGRYAMACVEARLDGKALPERRPPCFFDPTHGPSASDVAWAPPGGQVRQVPACTACALQLASGYQPDSRMVGVGQSQQPYWSAGATYGSYAGGYYQGYGSVLNQVMLGTMLGNAMFPPTVYVDNSGSNGGFFGSGGGGGFGGGGDFGGFSGGSGGGDF